jgi:hypothetical protein
MIETTPDTAHGESDANQQVFIKSTYFPASK